jgi:hypothetical protein
MQAYLNDEDYPEDWEKASTPRELADKWIDSLFEGIRPSSLLPSGRMK